jgi:FolB domain-containing protein
MDQVIIRDLRVRAIIGVYAHERQEPQDILINLTLYSDLRKAGESDDLADSIDYAMVAEKVRAHAEGVGRFTVEALASDLAGICLQIPNVNGVRVRVEKPGAVPFCKSVGVEIERRRA